MIVTGDTGLGGTMSQEHSMRFPADVAVLASVRDFALWSAAELGAEVDLDDLAIIVGELAANAAEHQEGDATLAVRLHDDGCLEVEIHDPDPTIPVVIDSAPDDPDGHRGLYLVSVLSHAWGVEPQPEGKRIWATLAPRR